MNIRALIGKLSDSTKLAVEKAAALAIANNNYSIELAHIIHSLIKTEPSFVAQTLKKYGADLTHLERELLEDIEHMKSGAQDTPPFSPNVVEVIRKAWLLSSLEFGTQTVSDSSILIAILQDDALRFQFQTKYDSLVNLDCDGVVADGWNLVKRESRQDSFAQKDIGDSSIAHEFPGLKSNEDPLEQYTENLTNKAKRGGLDQVVGRESEIRQLIDILCRRRQNNPILTGEAGVGKTAVVEGFAQKIVDGLVPDELLNVSIRILDLVLLQAGAGVKGEFENRLKSVIQAVKESETPIILFIDEAHSMVGAGGNAGQSDAANILKPALARGELRTIAATTWSEYKKYFEKDAALSRRFQVIKVEEPNTEQAKDIVRSLVSKLETHHNVTILEEAVEGAVELSKRYVAGRQLPDICVSVLDTACSRISLEQNSSPGKLQDLHARLECDQLLYERLQSEQILSDEDNDQLNQLSHAIDIQTQSEIELSERWEKEKQLSLEILDIRKSIYDCDDDPERLNGYKRALISTETELRQLQDESPLVRPYVDVQVVAEVISSWTGIPIGKMHTGDIEKVLDIKPALGKRIVGQDYALQAVADSMLVSSAKISDPSRPNGVFMFCGSSGVGKTETALAIADLLYGGEHDLTVINMSEYKEEHKVSLLMGSPPGYVGYGEGGVLTEAVRRNPYSVILLDEIEKAHPGVQDIFYQVFDKGQLKDGEGRDIDFRNCLIIMTTNAGTETITKLGLDPDTAPPAEKLESLVKDELLNSFKPAFLGRVRIVPFIPLDDKAMFGVVELQLEKIASRIAEQYNSAITFSEQVKKSIVQRCQEVDTGARNAIHIINRNLLPLISSQILANIGADQEISSISVELDEKSNFSIHI